jgi:Zn ribbon nucleic-acid-binding protein
MDFLRGMTLEPIMRKVYKQGYINPNRAWPFIVPLGVRGGKRTHGFQFCSKCFKEKRFYLKKEWKLSWNTVCEEHGVMLTSRCSQCNSAFYPHQFSYDDTDILKCRQCGFDLRENSPKRADKKVEWLQNKLNKMAFGESSNKIVPMDKTLIDSFSTFRIMISLFRKVSSVKALQRLAQKIGTENIIYTIPQNNTATEQRDISDRYALMYMVSRLFLLTQDEIVETLKECGVTTQMILSAGSSKSPFIVHLLGELENSSRYYPLGRKRDTSIVPKSKEEIERLMDEIRQYI